MPYQAPINSYYDSWGKGPLQLPGITPSVIGAYGSLTNFGPTWGTAQAAPNALPATPAGSPLNTSVGGPFGSLPRTTASSSGGYGLALPNANAGFQGYGGGPAASNPNFSTLWNVKSEPIDSATNTLLGSYNSVAGSPIKQTYLDRLKESEGTALSNYNAENPTVTDTYSGKLAADLRALSQGQYDSEKAAADFAVAEALMPAKSADIRMGGQAGRNSGSYTDRIAIGAVTPIRLKLASDMANREAANFRDVRANQLQLLGAANARLDQFNQRALMPLQFQQSQLGAEAALLNPISQMQQSNRFYGVTSPLTGVSQGYGVPQYSGGGGMQPPYAQNYNPFAPSQPSRPSIQPVTQPRPYPYFSQANPNVISSSGWNDLFAGTDMSGITGATPGGYTLANNYAGYDNPMSPLYTPGWTPENQAAMSAYYEG